MALDAFLVFEKEGIAGQSIQGETQDKDMKAAYSGNIPFDLQNWSFGLSQEVKMGSASGGVGAGKVTFEQFKVTKAIDKASPLFFSTCCTGGHYGEVSLLVRKAGAKKGASGDIYLKFQFKVVFLANITWSHADPAPTEELTFDYGALKISYFKQLPSGQLDTTVKEGMWSRIKNSTDYEGTGTDG